jgi:hypothetical protein
VLLMIGLTRTPASSASLLLNLEGVFTATIAWFVYHENVDRRIAFGMLIIVLGGGALSWEGSAVLGALAGRRESRSLRVGSTTSRYSPNRRVFLACALRGCRAGDSRLG